MIGSIREFYEYNDDLPCSLKAGNELIIKKAVEV
jgi:hypothetical protein